jgi:hypothetical protein
MSLSLLLAEPFIARGRAPRAEEAAVENDSLPSLGMLACVMAGSDPSEQVHEGAALKAALWEGVAGLYPTTNTPSPKQWHTWATSTVQ